jgi:TatD DNase family protein
MIDSHCHLADEGFVPDLAEVVARARAAHLSGALCILSADEPAEVARAAGVRQAWPDVRFAAAIHPHRSAPYEGRVADATLATQSAVDATDAVAVGEIGLDYHYDFAPRDVQRAVFAAQVEFAVSRDLPVVIHARLAAEDTVAVLREAGRGRARGVLHCFTGTWDEAQLGLELGFYVSLAGIVTFPKAASLRDVARRVPLDRLLVETDAPFLAPVPHRGQRNEPAWVRETAALVARERGLDVQVLEARLDENARALFGAWRAAE